MTTNIFCYGDSNTAGYSQAGSSFHPFGDSLAALHPNAKVTVVGMSGWTTSKMVQFSGTEMKSDLFRRTGPGLLVSLRKQPYDIICLMAGTNDIERNVAVDEIVSNMEILIKVCLFGSPSAQVLLMSVPATSRSVSLEDARTRRAEINGGLEEIAQTYKHRVTFVDTSAVLPHPGQYPWTAASAAHVPLWDQDLLHFSAVGSQRLGEFMHQTMLNRGLLRA